jgi:heptosyltransferase-3
MRVPKRILIVALRQIGDTLVTTPLIDDVRSRWPEADIDFLGFAAGIGILSGHPYLREGIVSPERPSRVETWQLIRRLWRRYDLALITQPNDRSFLLGLIAARTRYAVVPNDVKQGWWKRWLSARTVEVDYFAQHVVTEKRRLLEHPVRRPVSLRPPLAGELPSSLSLWLEGKPYVVVHATPLGAYKRISETTWLRLMESLAQRFRIVLTGSKSPSDRALNARLCASVSDTTRQALWDASGELDFPALTRLLEGGRLFLGVDTSVSHLAAAVGLPMVVFFGPTPPTNFGPWPKGFEGEQPYALRQPVQRVGSVTLIQGAGDCVPCRRAGCDDSTSGPSECLLGLTYERLWPEIEKRLAEFPFEPATQ